MQRLRCWWCRSTASAWLAVGWISGVGGEWMSERVIAGRFPSLPIEAQAELVERQGLDTLLRCKNAWALRHKFLNRDTGELIRARCGSWSCLYCGPRKVDMWRQ